MQGISRLRTRVGGFPLAPDTPSASPLSYLDVSACCFLENPYWQYPKISLFRALTMNRAADEVAGIAHQVVN